MKLYKTNGELIDDTAHGTVKETVLYCIENNIFLSRADLRRADLIVAKNIFIFNKENGRTCYAVRNENELMIQAGCFWGTLDEFETACIEKYGNDDKQNYSTQIKYLRSL